ncbi:MAG: tetratricopeptide repeat protein, partial [Chitinivibrionales bacterium]|nr:tetratricopeptide repeat protein [Chitinivibrionales bacterium]
MKTYSISEHIKKHGAGEYLKSIRTRCRHGFYSAEEFRYHAAKTYLSIELPQRAMALLNGLDPDYAPSEDQPAMRSLYSRAREMRETTGVTCSLNMIVRDECERIMDSLDSVDDIMDEIVICDTGSVDTTRELAQLYGITLVCMEWNGNFSHARNAAVDASTSNWIFWLDADDAVEQSCKKRLRKIWRRNKNQVIAFTVANELPGNHGPEFNQFRLFPRKENVRFERRAHEQVVFSAKKEGLKPVVHKEIRILHRGYNDPEMQKKKALRNKPLIEAECRENPSDISMKFSLGECHTILGEIDKAIGIFSQIAGDNSVYSTHRDTFIHAHFDLGWLYKTRNNFEKAKRYLARTIYLDQHVIEAHYLLGLIFYAEKSYQKAFNFFVRALARKPHNRYVAAVDTRGIKMNAFYYVGDILLRWKKMKEAEELLMRALRFYPGVVEYYTQMGVALFGMNRVKDAALYFSHSLTVSPRKNPRAYEGLAAIYLRLNDPKKAADFLLKALENDSSSAEIYALIGDVHFILKNPEIALDAYE